jgi:hypothetical protein
MIYAHGASVLLYITCKGSQAKFFHSEQTLNNWIMLIITSQALAFLYTHILE